jgi:ABC-type polysaccharide/polyol phosphate export permease
MATVSGMIYAHFHDTKHILEIVFQICFYLTPIIWPLEMLENRRRFAWVAHLNPFTHVMEVVRRPILNGELASLTSYGVCLCLMLAAMVFAALCLKKLEKNLVFWL